MKKIFFTLIVIALFSSCYLKFFSAHYGMSVKEVKRNDKIIKMTKSAFEDSLFVIICKMDSMCINVQIKNKSGVSSKINWYEAYFTFPGGEKSRVMHSAYKTPNRVEGLLPTVISAKKTANEYVYPLENFFWISDYSYNLKDKSFIKSSWGDKRKKVKAEAETNLNKIFKFTFPVYTDNKRNEYTFVFNISEYTITKGKEYNPETTYGFAVTTFVVVDILVLFYLFFHVK
ncbi:MAG: hypothetical protein PHD97_05680 [Bacteroidales bacterium]|nr:hypothetical protein [Bacteroidales bacterium]